MTTIGYFKCIKSREHTSVGRVYKLSELHSRYLDDDVTYNYIYITDTGWISLIQEYELYEYFIKYE